MRRPLGHQRRSLRKTLQLKVASEAVKGLVSSGLCSSSAVMNCRRGGCQVLWQFSIPIHEWPASLGPCFLHLKGGLLFSILIKCSDSLQRQPNMHAAQPRVVLTLTLSACAAGVCLCLPAPLQAEGAVPPGLPLYRDADQGASAMMACCEPAKAASCACMHATAFRRHAVQCGSSWVMRIWGVAGMR